MLLYEYRLALEFWGFLALAAFLTPLTLAGARRLIELLRDTEDERCSVPLSSVPSTPGPV